LGTTTLSKLDARTAEVDALFLHACNNFLTGRLPGPFALIAVGGYGRRELFPHSDVDLILLLENEPSSPAIKDGMGELLRTLWDASVPASHSVRTVAECCRLNDDNPRLHFSLLDVRYLCGDLVLYQKLEDRLPEFYRSQSDKLLRALEEMTRERHDKYGRTVYHLEPNVKDGPGGLRDVHLLHWFSLLAYGREPLLHSSTQIDSARAFLSDVRFFLHTQTGRDNNILSFELQDKAAECLASPPVAPEDWMRLYYRHARAVFGEVEQALDYLGLHAQGLIRQFLESRSRLSNADFTVSHDRVFLRHPASTLNSLPHLSSLFEFVARQGTPLSWDARRRISARARELTPASSGDPISWPQWRTLLSLPHTALALREMHNTGILSLALPEWREIESLVVRDFYHRYTVDEHTLVAIDVIDQLAARKPGMPERFSGLAVEEHDLALVRLALLLHDIGKGTTPGEHVKGSVEAADLFFRSFGVPEVEANVVRFLIAHHLDLSSVMTGRDLDDPATAAALTAQIDTLEHLAKLALLTYADISAVNPTAMTPWRLEQLWRVYTVALHQFTRELVSDRIHLSGKSPVVPLLKPELNDFLGGLPTRYLRVHTPPQIEDHYRLAQRRPEEGVAVEVRSEPGAYVLTVVGSDVHGLFASVCGALASFGMNILRAEAASNSAGVVLDEFYFADPTRTLELNPEEIRRLEWTVECVAKGTLQVTDLLKRRRPAPRHHGSKRFRGSVRFDNEASDHSTLIEFVGEDRPGLLFDLASALKQFHCAIELVLVNTEAHRALDVLYVTERGGKLKAATETALAARLRELADAMP
jgi:[protein-PII] uridylyltransferase